MNEHAARPQKLPMCDSDILASYNQAKNKTAQIGILADLNQTTKPVIRSILEDLGCILEEPKKGKTKVLDGIAGIKRPASKPWTPEEEDQLRRMREEGKSAAEIAEALGRGIPAVNTRVSMLQLGRPAVKKTASKETMTKDPGSPRVAAEAESTESAKTVPPIAPEIPSYIRNGIQRALSTCGEVKRCLIENQHTRACILLGEAFQILLTMRTIINVEETEE